MPTELARPGPVTPKESNGALKRYFDLAREKEKRGLEETKKAWRDATPEELARLPKPTNSHFVYDIKKDQMAKARIVADGSDAVAGQQNYAAVPSAATLICVIIFACYMG